MWGLIETAYDVIYFILKDLEQLRWQPLLFYLFYLFGKRSGMKMFRKFLQSHFHFFKEDSEEWRKYVTKQLVKLGAEPYIPVREYVGSGRRSRRRGAKNSNTLLKSSQPVTTPEGESKMKRLMIDPGHGGKDAGAVSCTKQYEKTFNLNVALKVAELFKDHPEVEVILTRSTDIFLELTDRSNLANQLKADAFISIHANSAFRKSASGTGTYYTRPESKAFADKMHPYMVQATGFRDAKVIKENFSVTRKTTMPAILLEPGFLSNPAEEAVLMTDEFQSKFALAIAQGVCAYLGVPYSVSTSNPVQTSGLIPIPVVGTPEPLTGYIFNNLTWLPARYVLDFLGASWGYEKRQVYVNGEPIETMIVDNRSYVKSRDLINLLGAAIFYEPNFENAKTVLIYPPKEGAIS